MDFDLKGIGSDYRRSEERRKPQPAKGEFARHFQSFQEPTPPAGEDRRRDDGEASAGDQVQLSGGHLSAEQVLRIYGERMGQEIRQFLAESGNRSINPATIALLATAGEISVESVAEQVARNAYRAYGLVRGARPDGELTELLLRALDRGMTQVEGILEGLSSLTETTRNLIMTTHRRAFALLSSLPS